MRMKRYTSVLALDETNARTFKEEYADGEYTCIMCGAEVTLDGCVSLRGYNLIYNRCYESMVNITGNTNLLNDIHNRGVDIERYIKSKSNE